MMKSLVVPHFLFVLKIDSLQMLVMLTVIGGAGGGGKIVKDRFGQLGVCVFVRSFVCVSVCFA